jgi:hypothetical protein
MRPYATSVCGLKLLHLWAQLTRSSLCRHQHGRSARRQQQQQQQQADCSGATSRYISTNTGISVPIRRYISTNTARLAGISVPIQQQQQQADCSGATSRYISTNTIFFSVRIYAYTLIRMSWDSGGVDSAVYTSSLRPHT